VTASCPIVSHNSSTTETATQKYLTDEIQTSPPAPVAVRGRRRRSFSPGVCVARGRRRAGRQQISRRAEGGTVMRHFLAARPVATRPRSMGEPSRTARLVAPSGSTQAAVAGPWRTIAGAIDLPTIAVTADQHLAATARAHIEPGRYRAAIVASAAITWTNATIAAILAPHACPARCGARRRA